MQIQISRLSWHILRFALGIAILVGFSVSPVAAHAATPPSNLYVDAKLGFSLHIPAGWTAAPHSGSQVTPNTSSVEFYASVAKTGFSIVVQHGTQTYASLGTTNTYIGSYPAVAIEFPATKQSPLACSERVFSVELDHVVAQWCGSSQASHSNIEHILATYKVAQPGFIPSQSVLTNAVISSPPDCLQLQRNNFHNPTGTYTWGTQLGTPTSTSPANGWFHYNPGTYVCSNTGSPDGWLFQCTDLANRFVREQWSLGTLYEDGDSTFNNYLHGNAGQYFDYWSGSTPTNGTTYSAGDAQFFADVRWLSDYQQAFPNQSFISSLPPQPGDLLIWQDVNNASTGPKSGLNGGTGHVAVVTGTDASHVYTAQQNFNDVNYFYGYTLQQSGGGYIIDSGNFSGVPGRVAVGWIHFTENGGPAPTSANNDFNGDRLSDAMAFYDYGTDPSGNNSMGAQEWQSNPGTTRLTYRYSQGVWPPTSGYTWSHAKWISGDFNGDGKTDAMAFYDLGSPAPYNVPATEALLWTSTGSGLSNPVQVWTSLGHGGFDWSKATWISGDFNGDGKADAMAFYNTGTNSTAAYTWLSPSTGSSLIYKGQVWSTTGYTWSNAKWISGDFNGDGLSDAMAFYNYGNSTTGAQEWLSNPGTTNLTYRYDTQVWPQTTGYDWTKAKWISGDFNGDGLSDAMAFYDYGNSSTGAQEWLSNAGTSLLTYHGSQGVWPQTSGYTWSNANWVSGDFNGDGRSDAMAFYNYGSNGTGAQEWLSNPGTTLLTYHGVQEVWGPITGYTWTKAAWLP